MSRAEAREAAEIFERLRDEARRRSLRDWLATWRLELAGLAAEAVSSRRPWRSWPACPPRLGRSARARPRWLNWLWRDLTWSAGQLRRSPVFSVVAVGSVACGMAGSLVVFTVANAVLWRPLPGVSSSESLVRLFYGESGVWSYPDYLEVTSGASGLGATAAFATSPVAVGWGARPPRERMGQQVSQGYFETLGVRLALGRPFRDDDGDAVVVVGHELWQRELGGTASVLGMALVVRGESHTVVGVAPPRLSAIAAPVVPDVYTPIPRSQREDRDFHNLDVIARLGDGVSPEAAGEQATALAQRLREAHPPPKPGAGRDEPLLVRAYTEREARVPPRDRAAILGGVGGAVAFTGLIALIVCANLANMVLTRGLSRRREIGVRLALGASRGRLVAQLLTESLLLAAVAGGLALLGVHLLTVWLAAGPVLASVPAGVDLRIDSSVVGFALLAATLAGIAFGLMPALEATRPDLIRLVRGGGGALAGPGGFGLRRLLVTGQIATSLVLIAASGVLTRELVALHDVRLGFDPDRVAVLPIDTAGRQGSPEATRQFFERVEARIAALPGVEGVAFAEVLALGGSRSRERGTPIEGYEPPPGRETALSTNSVSAGYFAVARIPMRAGRGFDSGDRPGAPPVVVVDEAFVREFWPDGEALGRRVGDATVVGVAASTRYRSLRGPELPMVWRCLAQRPADRMVAHVRTAGPPEPLLLPLARAVSELDDSLVLTPSTWRSLIGESLLLPRLLIAVFAGAGLLAVALAALGVYGVMAYAVGLRSREMGVRLALGASPGRVMRQVWREGLALSSAGLAIGSLLSVGVTLALGSALSPSSSGFDPAPLVLACLTLTAVASAASFLPARRAARVDPAHSLRHD